MSSTTRNVLLALASLSTVCGLGFDLGLTAESSSCLSLKDPDTCRAGKDDETGEKCVWCTCKAVPSECLSSSLAKKLPKAVFTCDDAAEAEDGQPHWAESPVDTKVLSIFEAWKAEHGVSYPDAAEEYRRFAIFEESLRAVTAHNDEVGFAKSAELHAKQGEAAEDIDALVLGSGYALGLNRFSDMTWEEFQSTRLGFYGRPLAEGQNCSATHVGGQYKALDLAEGRDPPAKRDWRDLGAVSEVKDQAHCGSCWTFSTTGCLESHHYLRTGEMVLLSEQQLVDCAMDFDNHGCNGGLPSHAFEYIAASGGLDTEQAYPYKAEESGSCSFIKDGVGADVIRSVNITFQDETELLEAVGNTGPVSVAFQVASDFKAYAGGVYDNPECSTSPEQVNHAVLAVGYDTTPDGVDYWIIKNSWGAEWGIDGYFHMVRGKNMCGVADCASFPLVP